MFLSDRFTQVLRYNHVRPVKTQINWASIGIGKKYLRSHVRLACEPEYFHCKDCLVLTHILFIANSFDSIIYGKHGYNDWNESIMLIEFLF